MDLITISDTDIQHELSKYSKHAFYLSILLRCSRKALHQIKEFLNELEGFLTGTLAQPPILLMVNRSMSAR